MLATLAPAPFDSKEWLYEIKWDGYRTLASINDGDVLLFSRNHKSFNERFSSVVNTLKEKIKQNVILDGEVVIQDDNGISRFQLLQNYMNTGKGTLQYYIFDILWLEGYSTEELPLLERKELLKEIIPENDEQLHLSDYVLEKGKQLFKEAKKSGLEGLVAKKVNSKYFESIRTKEWLKIKTSKRQEVVICGYTEPRGSRKFFGALVLGVYEKGELIYVGHTGTGFDNESLKDMHKKLQHLKRAKSPFKEIPKTNAPVTWLKPELVCEINFTEWTDDGHMRHPVFAGLRIDKDAKDVHKEKPKRN